MRNIFIAFFLLMTVNLIGQSGAKFSGGIVIATNQNLTISPENTFKTGWHAGVDARFGPFNWYLSPGLHYYRHAISAETEYAYFEGKESYHVLKFPVAVGYKIILTDWIKIRVKGGFDLNYISSIDDNVRSIDLNSVYDTYFGAHLGAGIDIWWLTFDVTYEQGLSRFYRDFDGSGYNYLSVSSGIFF